MTDPLSLVTFPATEEAYRAWVKAHPDGFLIHAWKDPANKPPDRQFMMWHQANCSHIDPLETDTQRYVTSNTLKACSLNPAALAMWAKTRNDPLIYCKHCQAAWPKSHGEPTN